jgi:hypothetical protein
LIAAAPNVKISVLIPAHNDAEVLRECLDAVLNQTRQVDELIVVADTCTDHTVEVARSYGAVVVETEQGGKAASQEGLAYVTGDILVCIDADQALVGFPCYWIANWWNKAIYFWTFIREWILGRHYVSWTGRQGRPTEIAPMSVARRHGLAGTGLLMLIPLFVK